MRILVVLAVVLTPACGGKLLIEDADTGAVPASSALPPVADAPTVVAVACEQPVPSTPDFGAIDASRLGCACRVHEDCASGEMCIEFPSIDHPRCAATDDACSLVRCRDNATCVVNRAIPALPVCYR